MLQLGEAWTYRLSISSWHNNQATEQTKTKNNTT